MAYTKYSLTPADNNAAPPNGAPEGMLPSAVNDTMRDMMSQIRDVGDGIRGGTYTMTAPVITGGSITGVALSGNTLTNPVITGGSINNTTVGATTRSTGAFTTLASNGATTFTAGTASTSTTTGTAVITGGLGVSGRINAANFDGIVGANTAAAGNFTTLGATGVATFSAGTVSAPAITTTGDTNTGIFFPAADTIAFTEGGVESMRINSSGQVGIGVTSPIYPLDIFSAGSGLVRLRGGSSTNQGGAYFVWKSDDSASLAAFGDSARIVGGTPDQGVTVFANNVPISFYSSSERMRITSAGNVGIGTTSPSTILHISKSAVSTDPASAATIVLSNRNSTLNGDIAGGVFMDTYRDIANPSYSAGMWFIKRFGTTSGSASSESDIVFGAMENAGSNEPTERMRITSAGNVIVGGTAVPNNSASLGNITINGSSGSILNFNVGNTTTEYANIFHDGTNFELTNRRNGGMLFKTNFTERMRIDSSGNVGIGTTVLDGRFTVSGTATQRQLSGETCWNSTAINEILNVSSGTLTTVATLTKPAGNSTMRRVVFSVTTTISGGDTGYTVACSVREVLMSNYGGSTSIIKSTELSNNQGSINSGILNITLTTAAALSGTTVLLQATPTITGSASAGLTARVMTKVEIMSDVNYQPITF